ncbi:hypothetical protein HPP92_014250 [Vanilla planifolia]|uniref:Uncharacterized protein n=1 Tax=Vanilla planifolia TaxID=51239 RepID=A0A835QRJ5_VANPL|nr:hypothetical protein HPP92_014250 [Vanilla planifolia]
MLTSSMHGVLGGLGQFGIITRATIALRASSQDGEMDQSSLLRLHHLHRRPGDAHLVKEDLRLYRRLCNKNKTGLLNIWRSSFKPQDPVQASRFNSEGRTLYCLEMTKNFDPNDPDMAMQVERTAT